MRLDRYLSQTTSLSRSQAQAVIRQGRVVVDGARLRDPAAKVSEESEIRLDGKPLSAPGPRYYMLNKPMGVVSASRDSGHRSALDLLDVPNRDKLHIAGRLDIDTTGLLLITDDGDWSHRVTAPRKKCAKRYRVQLAEPVEASLVERFREGIQLRNEKRGTEPAELIILSATEVLLTIHEGKYHQVKRMFAAVGNRVVGLHREAIGVIELDPGLAPGEYRELTAEEVGSVA